MRCGAVWQNKSLPQPMAKHTQEKEVSRRLVQGVGKGDSLRCGAARRN